jgi:hypothetical protein
MDRIEQERTIHLDSMVDEIVAGMALVTEAPLSEYQKVLRDQRADNMRGIEARKDKRKKPDDIGQADLEVDSKVARVSGAPPPHVH